jgi:hypothetical protein
MIFLLWLLIIVASLVDAWIKMILDRRRIYHGQVASLADVWIKMFQHFSGRR